MNRSASLSRLRIGRLALIALAAVVFSLAIASVASAYTDVGNYRYYTTSDVCQLTVTPATASLQTGSTHTVTATIASSGELTESSQNLTYADSDDVYDQCISGDSDAMEGADVTFTVTAGPNAGKTGVGTLDDNGQAKFSYTSTLIGTDTIEASIDLPDICASEYTGEVLVEDTEDLPASCDIEETPSLQSKSLSSSLCPTYATTSTCSTVRLTADAAATWTAPPAPALIVAANSLDPTVSLARFKRCVSRKFSVAPAYSGSTVKTSTLFVDGHRISTATDTESFSVNGTKYKAGKHNMEIVTSFTNGKSASKFASFTRCATRSAVKKVAPKFTG